MGRRVLGSTLVLLAFAFFARPGPGQEGAAEAPRWEIRTPPPGPEPKIHGPTLTGCRPGRPFLYRIPCTGTRPLRFHAEGLPAGLSLDADRGILRGTAPDRPGSYEVTLHAENGHGEARKALRIVVGDRLALTPPMGWNDWYTHYDRITDAKVREAAHTMIASGMADFGYQYVNIDDCWMVKPGATASDLGGRPRDDAGRIRPNRRFPDMKALTDYIHGKGLKAGIYTGPVPLTCAGHVGCQGHEEQDARRYAQWGFDFLKEDSCSSSNVPKMGSILQKLDRDVVLNVVAGPHMARAGAWGRKAGAHSWRTAKDLGGAWVNIVDDGFGLNGRNEIQQFSGPGGWNDPDYLCLGYVGGGVPTTLTPNQQYAYVSLWCLVTAPLIYSGDITRLDEFTLSLLTNDEVIEVDQDPLGQAARRVTKIGDREVWAKDMEDGRKIVGLFNLDETQTTATVGWSDLGITGKQTVRDLWRQKNLGTFEDQFSTTLGEFGVMLVSLRPALSP